MASMNVMIEFVVNTTYFEMKGANLNTSNFKQLCCVSKQGNVTLSITNTVKPPFTVSLFKGAGGSQCGRS